LIDTNYDSKYYYYYFEPSGNGHLLANNSSSVNGLVKSSDNLVQMAKTSLPEELAHLECTCEKGAGFTWQGEI